MSDTCAYCQADPCSCESSWTSSKESRDRINELLGEGLAFDMDDDQLDIVATELDRLRREREETERALREWCGDINGDIERFPKPHMRFLRDEFRARGLWRDPDAKEQGDGSV